jgi:hypothetical protein
MPRYRLGIWSPHRDSHSVLALKAALGLRPERWQWCDRPEEASFWIVDAQYPVLAELTEQLKQAKQQDPVFAALLATEWSVLRDPVWTFLKVPLQVKVVYQWIDGCLQKNSAHATVLEPPWLGQQLKLKRWPNMSQYAGDTPASGMQITAVCAKLLADWVRYEDLSHDVSDLALLDQLLRDAHQRGILEFTRVSSASQKTASSSISSSSLEHEGKWSLIKRLIRKFA